MKKRTKKILIITITSLVILALCCVGLLIWIQIEMEDAARKISGLIFEGVRPLVQDKPVENPYK
jgi:flagellar basal body-associated protein FliL